MKHPAKSALQSLAPTLSAAHIAYDDQRHTLRATPHLGGKFLDLAQHGDDIRLLQTSYSQQFSQPLLSAETKIPLRQAPPEASGADSPHLWSGVVPGASSDAAALPRPVPAAGGILSEDSRNERLPSSAPNARQALPPKWLSRRYSSRSPLSPLALSASLCPSARADADAGSTSNSDVGASLYSEQGKIP